MVSDCGLPWCRVGVAPGLYRDLAPLFKAIKLPRVLYRSGTYPRISIEMVGPLLPGIDSGLGG